MFNDLNSGVRVVTQEPLDKKLYFNTLAELINLGTNNNLAFSYYKNMRVYCVETNSIYLWRPLNSPTETGGAIIGNFTYPTGLESNGISYSNITYNFFIEYSGSALDIQNVGTGVQIYKNFVVVAGVKYFNFKSLESDNLEIVSTENTIKINIPNIFEGLDYYVNANYSGTVELGTPSKPFKTLTRCIDKILNRGIENSPVINSGNVYEKWENRNGQGVRINIQSFTQALENLAIQNVTYFLERGGYSSYIFVPSTITSVEYVFDMKPLVLGITKNSDGTLPYPLQCSLTGKGTVGFSPDHVTRKGILRAYGYNNGDLNLEQPDCYFILGENFGDIFFLTHKNTSLNYIPLYSDDLNTIPIIREQIEMTGLAQIDFPNYGVIEVEGRNSIYYESLSIRGKLVLSYFEQHGLYLHNHGRLYGDSGTIYLQRSYQHVNFSSIETIAGQKTYKPSEYVYDFYLKNGGSISYGGDILTQGNTGATQGGADAFIGLENTTTNVTNMCSIVINGGGFIHNLIYNHYIKQVLNPIFNDYQQNEVVLNSFRFNSFILKSCYGVFDTLGIDWDKIVNKSTFTSCYLRNIFLYGITKPISNIPLQTKLTLSGTLITLFIGELYLNYPTYADNATAIADSYPIGGIYKDTSGNLKIVI